MDIENKKQISNKNINTQSTLTKRSFLMDINLLELPLFRIQKNIKTFTPEDLIKDSNISAEAKEILKDLLQEKNKFLVQLSSWQDSKNLKRELLTVSGTKISDGFAMDVFFALIMLYIKFNAPIAYDTKTKTYNIPLSNKLSFSIYELCNSLTIKPTGSNYSKVKEAIKSLAATRYYGLKNGVFFSKELDKYTIQDKKGISLLDSYTLSSLENGNSRLDKSFVKINKFILNNIKYGFVKFLNQNIYRHLKTGLERRLYTYLENNIYLSKGSKKQYIKRSFDVLSQKLNFEYEYNSRLKAKLNPILKKYIDLNIISNYFFGDEIQINGVKEQCIYIILKGTKQNVIDTLTKNNDETNEDLSYPKNIVDELRQLNITENAILKLTNMYSEYKLAEYILWIKDGIKHNKVKNPAGLFLHAINDNCITVSTTHPHITAFINEYKEKIEYKKQEANNILHIKYKKYLDDNINRFKNEDEFAFNAFSAKIFENIENVQDKKLKSQRQIYNMTTTKNEKEKLLKTIEKWEDFSVKKEESELFIELLTKEIINYLKLSSIEEFTRNFQSTL